MAKQSMKKALQSVGHLSFIVQMGENTCKSNEININEYLELENLKGKNGVNINSFHLIIHLNSAEVSQKMHYLLLKIEMESITGKQFITILAEVTHVYTLYDLTITVSDSHSNKPNSVVNRNLECLELVIEHASITI